MKLLISSLLISIGLMSCGNKLEKKIVSSYPNGTPMQIEYYRTEKGKQIVVKETRFFPNGEKSSEGEWTPDNKKDGKWKQWFSNGELWIEEEYKNGMKNGSSTVWQENGKKLYEGEYNEDKPTGTWKYYDSKGNISKKETIKE